MSHKDKKTKKMHDKISRRTYGFDEISLVPSDITLDIELCDTQIELCDYKFSIPIIASAMDSVCDPKMISLLDSLGGLGVLNLQGLQTRYTDSKQVYNNIAQCDNNNFIELMQEIYSKPIDEKLIELRIDEIKKFGSKCAVSLTPNMVSKYIDLLKKCQIDILVIQSTVTGLNHYSVNNHNSLDIKKLCKSIDIPVIIGNCVSYDVALNLMKSGASGILVGIGPGAACTSRKVLGIGVPMATTINDCAQAKEDFESKNSRKVSIIADGGMLSSGDICKAFACGADAVMIGSPLAKAQEAPGLGYHWGMATPSPVLPRGTRVKVGTIGSLEQILFGPAKIDDGTQNLIGALKTCMSTIGTKNIAELQMADVIIAPSILSEGKLYQTAQNLGMGRS